MLGDCCRRFTAEDQLFRVALRFIGGSVAAMWTGLGLVCGA
jgi:hypothetical protein